MTTNRIEEAVAAALDVLRERPSALISDVDGTLSPIARSPEEAAVLPECRDALAALSGRIDLVAVVSGRRAAEARRMVDVDALLYVGNHGLERWDSVDGYRNEAAPFESDMQELRAKLDTPLKEIPGVRIEDKGSILALHYRGASRPEAVRRQLLELLNATLSDRLTVAEGKMVIEVRPPLELDKGTVVERLASERGLRGIVYLGDDVTDIDAMKGLRRLRGAGMRTLAIGVAGEEAPAALADESDLLLPDPRAVASFLGHLAESLSNRLS